MKGEVKNLSGSVTGKVLFIAFLILVLLVPLGMIEGLVAERAQHYDAARDDIGRAWGRAQTIGGPILVIPFSYTRYINGQSVVAMDELYVLPQRLDIRARANAEQRRRGIYEVPVYTARLQVSGSFPPVTFGSEYPELAIRWEQAAIALPLADARSVREPIVLASGDGTTVFEAGGARVTGFGPLLVAPYAALNLGPLTAAQDFSFELVLGGTGLLEFLPLGDETRVEVTSSWPSPSFIGAFLPSERTVDSSGFTAEWRVLDLGRGYPPRWRRSDAPPTTIESSAFGAALITPVGIHETATRATKYGVLILGLTFVAYFLFELFAPLRLHALQYLLIGLANCVFYLLLLALAEHVGFGPAYLASAVAATTLITSYSGAALRSLRRAAPIGGLLTTLYAYLYVTLRAEDYALLFGALGVFATLAVLMYLTRRIDWFDVTFARPPDREPRVQLHA
jgi:inner membrane protein